MSGSPANVTNWADADVWLGSLLTTDPSGGAAFPTTGQNPWSLVGLLDGSAGFGEDQSWTNTPYNAWGQGEIGSTNTGLAITRTFTAMEVDNPAVLGLRYDVSGVTFGSGGMTGTLAARNLAQKIRLGFEARTNGIIDRRITKGYAVVTALGTVTQQEGAPATQPVTVKVYPDLSSGKPVYWSVFKGAAS